MYGVGPLGAEQTSQEFNYEIFRLCFVDPQAFFFAISMIS